MAVDISHIKDRDIANAFDSSFNVFPFGSYTAITNTASFTATTAQFTNASVDVTIDLTGTLAGAANLTTPTALQIAQALPGPTLNHGYVLTVINNSSGAFAWTLVGGSGVTVSGGTGGAAIAQHTSRYFLVTITAMTITNGQITAATVTIQNIGSGTN